MELKDLYINSKDDIKNAINKLNKTQFGIVFVMKDDCFYGIITDYDIRNNLLNGIKITESLESITNKKPIILKKGYTEIDINKLANKHKDEINPLYGVLKIPVIDDGKILDIIYITREGLIGKYSEGIHPKNHRVLIIGGAGYLGSVLCRDLLDNGYSVTVLDNFLYGNRGIKNIKNPRLTVIKGDICNLRDIVNAMDGVKSVIHLAAIVGDEASAFNPKITVEINLLSAKLVAEICKYLQINRFIFASTCSVYGEMSNFDLLTEESKLNPVSLYANTKLETEKAILSMSDGTFSPTILRMGTLYGISERMRFDLVVNLLTIKACIDKKYMINGGNQFRGFCHIKDASNVYIKCLEAPLDIIGNQIFNVASSNMSILELGKLIKEECPQANMIINTENRDCRDYKIDSKKLIRTLDIKFKYTIRDGIREIINNKDKYNDYKHPIFYNYGYMKILEELIDDV